MLASGGPSNAVYVLDLDAAGHLTPDAHHTIAIPGPADDRFANAGHAFPSTIVLSPTGARAYVVDNVGDDVAQIDVATRTLAGSPIPVGFFPFGAAYSTAGLLVANEGLTSYGALRATTAVPPFATPAVDLDRASSVSFLATNPDESLGAIRFSVPLDRGPDGAREVGGTHPSALAALRTKPYAFVAMSNVDRIATLSLASSDPRAVGGTELRLYDRGPYGTQPVALALSPDETRLYVALAGIDAIAVLDVTDPLHPHRIGLIPTGWDPTSMALSKDGRYLFVANAKGYGTDRAFTGDQANFVDSRGRVMSVTADSTAVWSTLERIDTTITSLRHSTPLALASLRAIRPATTDRIVPQTFASSGSTAIKHVVVILEESKTYDAMLGRSQRFDRPCPRAGRSAIRRVRRIGYAESPRARARVRSRPVIFMRTPTNRRRVTTTRRPGSRARTRCATRRCAAAAGPVAGTSVDPEDYTRAGTIYNSLAQRGKRIAITAICSGFRDTTTANRSTPSSTIRPAPAPTTRRPRRKVSAALRIRRTGSARTLGHVDLNYPGL